MDADYTGEEKRRQGRTIADVEAAFERKLYEHELRETARIKELIAELTEEAFPDGAVKHGEYHQAKINSAKEEAEYWKAAKMELTKGGVATVLWVLKTVAILAGMGLLYKFGLGGLIGMVATK